MRRRASYTGRCNAGLGERETRYEESPYNHPKSCAFAEDMVSTRRCDYVFYMVFDSSRIEEGRYIATGDRI